MARMLLPRVVLLLAILTLALPSAAAAEIPVNVTPPTLEGDGFSPTDEEGGALSATPGSWSQAPSSVTFSWLRCNTVGEACESTEATGSLYPLTSADIGKTVRVIATAHYGFSEGEFDGTVSELSEPSAVIRYGPPTLLSLPSFSGLVMEGQTLTVSTGGWSSPLPLAFTYQWGRCAPVPVFGYCDPITGATEQTYTPGPGDVGMTLWAIVDAAEQGELASRHTVSGTAFTGVVEAAVDIPVNLAPPKLESDGPVPMDEEGGAIAATTGSWSKEPNGVSFSWFRCDAAGEACESTEAMGFLYPLTAADVGKTIRALATAHYGFYELEFDGTVSELSEPSAVIRYGPPMLLSVPSISGRVQEGHALTVSTGEWSSPLPLGFTYQWGRCVPMPFFGYCDPIPGATEQTYTPGPGDVGMTLWAIVDAAEQGDLASRHTVSGTAFTGVVEQQQLTLTPDGFSTNPRTARPGGNLGATLHVRRSDTGAHLESGGSVSCRAYLANRRLELVRSGWSSGAAECVWRVPSRINSARINAAIAVAYRGASVRRNFSVPTTR